MKIETWEDAYHLAMAAGSTAATVRAHKRTWGMKWSVDDYDHCCQVVPQTMRAFGFGPCPGAPVSAWDRIVEGAVAK